MSNIAIALLNTGIEVITQVDTVENNGKVYMRFTNPCQIVATIGADGTVNAEMVPLALFSKGRIVVVSESAIVFSSEPTDEAREAYEKLTQPKEEKLVLAPEEKKIVLPA